ncbi:MAG: methyltransferase [Candidatus Thorarchaeota archaeon]
MVDYQNFTVFPDVYPPSGDTYLLLDSIQITSDDDFLEVGCGAGLITLKGAERARSAVSVDVSLDAVRNTKENLSLMMTCQQVWIMLSLGDKQGQRLLRDSYLKHRII